MVGETVSAVAERVAQSLPAVGRRVVRMVRVRMVRVPSVRMSMRDGLTMLVDLGIFIRVLVGRRIVLVLVLVRDRVVLVLVSDRVVIMLVSDRVVSVLVRGLVVIVVGLVVANDRAGCVVMMRANMVVRRDVKPGEQLEAREPQHACDQRHPGASALAARHA